MARTGSDSDSDYPPLNEHERKLSNAAKLAQDLFAALLGFDAALTLVSDDRIRALIPPVKPDRLVPTGTVTHLESQFGHEYDFARYLNLLREEPNRTLTSRLWASSALIRLGEELKHHAYFDRHPSLELIRHLRNAAAHGERFRIDDPQKLARYPGHLTAGLCHWEITPALHGTPLYDKFSVGDIASTIFGAGIHMNNMALARHIT